MISEDLCQHRFNQWQSLFSKYQNAESTDDYVYPENSWLPAQKINTEGPPEDVKELIDKVWQEEGNEVDHSYFGDSASSKHTGGNDCGIEKKHFTKDYDASVHRKTGNILSLSSSSADEDYDSDDDYESYESDSSSEDGKPLPVGKTKFFTIFAGLSRLRSLHRKRERSASIIDALLKERSSREKGFQTTVVSSPTKRVSICSLEELSPQKPSPQESVRSRLSDVPVTLAPSTESPHEKYLSQGHPPSTSVTSSLVSHFSSTSSNKNSFDLQSRIRLCDVTLTNKVKLTEQRSSSRESSFSEHRNRMKINSPSKPKEGETPGRVKTTSRLYDGLKGMTSDASSLPLMSPSDENRKRRIFRSPQGHCQRSSEFLPKESRVKVILEPNASLISPSPCNSSGKIIVMDSSILRRRLSSERKSIRALKQGRSLFEI